jgi:tetratricopeptide (TPR) repeat protein
MGSRGAGNPAALPALAAPSFAGRPESRLRARLPAPKFRSLPGCFSGAARRRRRRGWPAPPAAFDRVSKEAAEAREQNRIQDAIGLYRQAVKMRPSWPEGWWFLGELLYDQDKYPEARDALRRLVSLDHKTGPGFALLGLCEYETKEYGKALDHINAARRFGLGEDPQAGVWYCITRCCCSRDSNNTNPRCRCWKRC